MINDILKKQEALLSEILELFAVKFDKHAVLRGGMVLRLLESPRMTNDLDYVFIPYKSKNDIKDDVLNALAELVDCDISHSLNSKCLRIIISRGDLTVQVEIKTAMEYMTETLSTEPLAKLYNQNRRIIPVVDFSVALANKLAAWLERRLVRDLFDIQFFLNIGIKADTDTLSKRLKKPQYSKLVKPLQVTPPVSEEFFYDFLKESVINLTQDEVDKEMRSILNDEDRAGLALKIKAAISSKL
ncbi:MAG: nucleotidyl transferase AbiEii/AbiGii toxin family protein [Planctomycetota bacterium]|jgi:predicted nucleotidyltransferase component of viral defense system